VTPYGVAALVQNTEVNLRVAFRDYTSEILGQVLGDVTQKICGKIDYRLRNIKIFFHFKTNRFVQFLKHLTNIFVYEI
jgi:L-cystine uptake protein TcyP (sodium:dicarboxylate symporter family)